MTRWTKETYAAAVAEKVQQYYGFCVLDGFYYTGTQEELERIVCLYITKGLTHDNCNQAKNESPTLEERSSRS